MALDPGACEAAFIGVSVYAAVVTAVLLVLLGWLFLKSVRRRTSLIYVNKGEICT